MLIVVYYATIPSAPAPAIKRRSGVEVRPQGVDEDAVEDVSLVGKYRQSLNSV